MMLRKLQKINKNRELVRYRFDLRQLDIKNECYDCQFIRVCLDSLIQNNPITLCDLCYQLKAPGKRKFIYASYKGLESIKRFCK